MPAKWNPPNLDDLIRRYVAGEPSTQLARQFGVDAGTVLDALRTAGVRIRAKGGHRRWMPPNPDSIIAAYVGGTSLNALSGQYGIVPAAVANFLCRNGITLRDNRTANQLMAAHRTPDENRRLTAAAHAASKGHAPSFDALCKAAQTRQERQINIYPDERQMAEWLLERDIITTFQRAIGPYNADLTTGAVAVEIHAVSESARYAARAPIRSRYILDAGWNLIIVWTNARRYGLTIGAANEVAAFVQETRRNPTLRGQYRVIWGDGRVAAPSGTDLTDFAFVPSRRRRLDTGG